MPERRASAWLAPMLLALALLWGWFQVGSSNNQQDVPFARAPTPTYTDPQAARMIGVFHTSATPSLSQLAVFHNTTTSVSIFKQEALSHSLNEQSRSGAVFSNVPEQVLGGSLDKSHLRELMVAASSSGPVLLALGDTWVGAWINDKWVTHDLPESISLLDYMALGLDDILLAVHSSSTNALYIVRLADTGKSTTYTLASQMAWYL
ncbi:hypothetical protein H696_05409 [Fonticula alba]|uniref:Uncharacterized protein n=1 Tax=Fonticula alba TaxID=691883 RepID=A0A058Z2I0_FONAL|nr:hypothetical protein H696_05409 [Fonticula alba]KCV68143.1 hypothetical protein H696_05409 [Fonticula alba]|eukprot:XP_009497517.1 hypothetical protein H696_05409 [Fonticula alba]